MEEEAVAAAEPGVEVDLVIEEVLVDISQERDADPGKYIISLPSPSLLYYILYYKCSYVSAM